MTKSTCMDDANRSGGYSHQRHRYTIRSFSNDLQVEYYGSGKYALANGSLNRHSLDREFGMDADSM